MPLYDKSISLSLTPVKCIWNVEIHVSRRILAGVLSSRLIQLADIRTAMLLSTDK